MTDENYDIERGLMLESIAKAVARFVGAAGEHDFSVQVCCDVPDMAVDADGKTIASPVIRIYVNKSEEDDDDDF